MGLRGQLALVFAGVALIAAALATWAAGPVRCDVGAEEDLGCARGFYGRESDRRGSFRWSDDRSAIRLPGIGYGHSQILELALAAPRPTGTPAPRVALRVGRTDLALPAGGTPRRYQVLLAAQFPDPEITTLTVQSDTFTPPNEIRRLGVTIYGARMLLPSRPAPPSLLMSLALLGLGLASAVVLGGRPLVAFAGGLLVIAGFAALWALLPDRVAPYLPALALISGPAALIARRCDGLALLRRPPILASALGGALLDGLIVAQFLPRPFLVVAIAGQLALVLGAIWLVGRRNDTQVQGSRDGAPGHSVTLAQVLFVALFVRLLGMAARLLAAQAASDLDTQLFYAYGRAALEVGVPIVEYPSGALLPWMLLALPASRELFTLWLPLLNTLCDLAIVWGLWTIGRGSLQQGSGVKGRPSSRLRPGGPEPAWPQSAGVEQRTRPTPSLTAAGQREGDLHGVVTTDLSPGAGQADHPRPAARPFGFAAPELAEGREAQERRQPTPDGTSAGRRQSPVASPREPTLDGRDVIQEPGTDETIVWLLALFYALSPLLLPFWHAKYDPLPAALLVAGLALFSLGRPGWAGAALGLGGAVKWVPWLAVPFVAWQLLQRDDRPRPVARPFGLAAPELDEGREPPERWRPATDARRPVRRHQRSRSAVHSHHLGQAPPVVKSHIWRFVAGFLIAVAVASLPFAVRDPDAFLAPYRLQNARPIIGESIWFPLGALLEPGLLSTIRLPWSGIRGAPIPRELTGAVQLAALGALGVAVLFQPRDWRRTLVLAALAPAVFLILNRVFSPQYLLVITAALLAATAAGRHNRRPMPVVMLLGVAQAANLLIWPNTAPYWLAASLVMFTTLLAVALLLVLAALRIRSVTSPV